MGGWGEGPGATLQKRHLAESPCRHRRTTFHSWFQFVLLLCLLLFVLCYALSFSSFDLYKHYDNFFNRTRAISLPSPFLEVTPQEFRETTAVPTTVTSTATPTVPSTAAPAWPQYHQAYPKNYHFIMDNPEACRNQTTFLVLMVPVAPNNVAARHAIRQTWGKERIVQGEVVLTLFVLGSPSGADVNQLQQQVKEENLKHHDLIQSNFIDTYKNLTIKTMVIMDWLVTHCPTAAYAMKVDSDVFLNIDNLVIMLKRPGIPRMNYLTGMLMLNRPVVRSKSSKWYVPPEMFPESSYPAYILGMAYVFSNDLPVKFVEVSKSIKPFNIEDAYIGMCMKKLGLQPSEPPDPSQFKCQTLTRNYNHCSLSKAITYLMLSARELKVVWADLKRPGPPCPTGEI